MTWKFNPKDLKRGQAVEVLDRGRWLPGIVDAPAAYGWVGVAGMPNRAGVASVRVVAVRTKVTSE